MEGYRRTHNSQRGERKGWIVKLKWKGSERKEKIRSRAMERPRGSDGDEVQRNVGKDVRMRGRRRR